MFWNGKNLKDATTLITIGAMVAMAFAAVARAVDCDERVRGEASCAAAPCCCTASLETRKCCCRQDDAPAPPQPAAPHDTGRNVTWTPWVDARLLDPMIAQPKPSPPLPSRCCFSSFQRSIQSLLCTWRI